MLCAFIGLFPLSSKLAKALSSPFWRAFPGFLGFLFRLLTRLLLCLLRGRFRASAFDLLHLFSLNWLRWRSVLDFF
jgi:hypothetical protein